LASLRPREQKHNVSAFNNVSASLRPREQVHNVS
jgi:hypothetical protein